MKAIIQRVSQSSVTVDKQTIGKINNGLNILLGIHKEDSEENADKLIQKILNIRIFSDEEGKMNKSILDIKGELLVISQFTLYADTSGRRPGFSNSAKPDLAKKLYEYFVEKLKLSGLKVETGEFGAMMSVEIINDGPVTITLEK